MASLVNTFEKDGCTNSKGLASATDADSQQEGIPELFPQLTSLVTLNLPPEPNHSPDDEPTVALLKGHLLRRSMLQISPLGLHWDLKKDGSHKPHLFGDNSSKGLLLLVCISMSLLIAYLQKTNKQTTVHITDRSNGVLESPR